MLIIVLPKSIFQRLNKYRKSIKRHLKTLNSIERLYVLVTLIVNDNCPAYVFLGINILCINNFNRYIDSNLGPDISKLKFLIMVINHEYLHIILSEEVNTESSVMLDVLEKDRPVLSGYNINPKGEI